MIACLRGTLLEKRPPALVVDVRGVGYELEAPMTAFYELPDSGAEVLLHTHLVVRDDAHMLFGFTNTRQRDLFRSLLKVSGVGPRVALAVLSSLSADEFIACIAEEDVARLSKVPGIGRKTAQRLVVEMGDRLLKQVGELPASTMIASARSDPVHDAVGALISLGYKAVDASRAVRAVAADGLSSEEIIRLALRALAGSVA